MAMTEHYAPSEPNGPSEPDAAATTSPWEPCDQCQAPLDERQRYCVVCGTHRANVDDPVARYLAEARRARTAPKLPSAASSRTVIGGGKLAAAIALIPIAAALGVLVGRGDSSDQQVVNALKVQKAPVVNVVAGGAGAATAATTGGTTSSAGGSSNSASSSSAPKNGKVLAKTKYGTARQLEGSKPTAQDIKDSKQALKTIDKAKGKAYVESQKNLPDTIVIP